MHLRYWSRLCITSVRFSSAKQKLKNYIFPVIRSEDCVQKIISGWGPGGQKVNMTRNAVTLKHLPTGVVVRVHQSRLLQENIKIAQERLKHAVDRHLNGENSHDAQLEQLERERSERNKKKKAAAREFKKSCVLQGMKSDERDLNSSGETGRLKVKHELRANSFVSNRSKLYRHLPGASHEAGTEVLTCKIFKLSV